MHLLGIETLHSGKINDVDIVLPYLHNAVNPGAILPCVGGSSPPYQMRREQ